MPGRRRTHVLLALVCAAAAAVAQDSPVLLWGSGDDAAGMADAAEPQRLWVRTPAGLRVAYSWDRVREVRGPRAAEVEPFMPAARDLWRARTRLERGDTLSAEPLFERAAAAFPRHGPSSAVADEGLLRCRLLRGAPVLAIEPWLRLIVAGELGAAARFEGLEPVATPGSPLFQGLPPFFGDTPAARALANDEGLPSRLADVPGPADAAAVGRTLAAIYRASAAGLPPSEMGANRGPDLAEDVRLAFDAVEMMFADADAAASARARLEPVAFSADGSASPGWRAAWALTALGIADAASLDPETAADGVLRLLLARVEHDATSPVVAGVALAHAAAALRRAGDAAAADALIDDLRRAFPGHDALDWPITNPAGDTRGSTSQGASPR